MNNIWNNKEATEKIIAQVRDKRVQELEAALTAIYTIKPSDHGHDYPCMVDEIMLIAERALHGGNAMTTTDKYKFWIEVENGVGGSSLIEWVNLTERTAKMMYNATRTNSRYIDSDLQRYGWRVQE